VCAAGHSFDRARSGYVNLLAPGDRRAAEAGDAKAIVAARRRTLERGLAASLLEAILERTAALALPAAASLLDAGCGEGFFLGALSSRFPIEGWGVDLSVAAVDAAARRHPNARFVVANVDRRLPFAEGSFRLILSILGRKNPEEFDRLLEPEGRLLIVSPAADDQAELREAMLGRVLDKGWAERTRAAFAPSFLVEADDEIRQREALDQEQITDLVAGTYRGVRRRARERLSAIDGMRVTSAWRVLLLRRR
jgi:23S rRNA (guanine745-N1)-methyltransferase